MADIKLKCLKTCRTR